MELPTPDDVDAAAARIERFVHHTPTLRCAGVDEHVGCRVVLKLENVQRAGAFKYRGATNAVQLLPSDHADRGVAAHSSGNHAAALARAAAARGIPAHLVMPEDAPRPKREATEGYGATVTLSGRRLEDRTAVLEAVLARTGATEIHPYDHPHVIAGAGTAARELLADAGPLDAVIAPVGGGGLLSGTTLAVRGAVGRDAQVWGAEPAGADDARRSLDEGAVQPSIDPDTICDGLLTSLSQRTFSILSGAGPVGGVDGIATATDDDVLAAMRTVMERAKLVVEPSGAIGVAVARRLVLDGRLSRTDTVGVIVSGGNLDLDGLPLLNRSRR